MQKTLNRTGRNLIRNYGAKFQSLSPSESTGSDSLGQRDMNSPTMLSGVQPGPPFATDTDCSFTENRHQHLHYTRPSTQWSEALPVGNGRLGAMVHGRTTTEVLHLNEDSVWYGGPQDRTPRDALQNLPLLRRLIRDGRHAEAEEVVRNAFFATPASMRHYEPLGTCTIEFGHGDTTTNSNSDENKCIFGYRRWLDISQSLCETQYSFCRNSDGDDQAVQVRRQVIASCPDQVILVRISTSRRIKFVIRLNRLSEIEWETNEFLDSIQATDDQILLQATPGGRDSNQLAIALGVRLDDTATSGSVKAVGNCLVVETGSCTIAVGAQTKYRVENPAVACVSNVVEALKNSWAHLLARHVADYHALFNRANLRMWPDASHLPTDERIQTRRDPGLIALYHNFGRYLLISSSRDSFKALPANLQGIWNPSFVPPWGSKYTININIQMYVLLPLRIGEEMVPFVLNKAICCRINQIFMCGRSSCLGNTC